ncbi:hypothetical protein [Methylocucumis oryzae]|uniref:Uncharacterized protein n=1 Tax=Methylocucumis oryzae TaxID=1632867 RepID=A0A0F3IER6_9GAMM|nr:hypothetical protein [Methylocucumis oryzae]KJV05236.1 hypothetical protein VZ94_19670 [Methylocucumis oryzae]
MLDDFDTIKYKWSQWSTPEYFSPNPTVINTMQKATSDQGLKRPTQAFTASRNSGGIKKLVA